MFHRREAIRCAGCLCLRFDGFSCGNTVTDMIIKELHLAGRNIFLILLQKKAFPGRLGAASLSIRRYGIT